MNQEYTSESPGEALGTGSVKHCLWDALIGMFLMFFFLEKIASLHFKEELDKVNSHYI